MRETRWCVFASAGVPGTWIAFETKIALVHGLRAGIGSSVKRFQSWDAAMDYVNGRINHA